MKNSMEVSEDEVGEISQKIEQKEKENRKTDQKNKLNKGRIAISPVNPTSIIGVPRQRTEKQG